MASSLPSTYQIHIRGLLGDTLLIAFPGLGAETRSNVTVLTWTLVDQAALHGVLAEIETLGLELLEVRRLDP
jgi:epsilon-lactone hydrolase